MVWGPIIGAVAGGLVSGYLNNQGAESRQEDAQEFSAQQFASRYQTTVKDMQAAGLNPMLAYSQGGGNPPTSSAASSAGYPDLGNTINQARMASAQVANIDADTENKKASAELIQAQIAQTRASAGSLEAATNVSNETVTKIKQEVVNLKTDEQKAQQLIINLREEWQNLVKQGYNLTEVGNQIRMTIKKIDAETDLFRDKAVLTRLQSDLARFDVEAAESFGNLGREAKEFAPFFNILRMFLKR